MSDYQKFLERRSQLDGSYGFDPIDVPSHLFDFQRHLVDWAIRKGRAAILSDCGTGKSLMQLVWAKNVAAHSKMQVLIVAPLAVSQQLVGEAQKFDIEAHRSVDGSVGSDQLVVTNYEKLHLFDPSMFGGMVCDESSILKNFDGTRKQAITDFMRKMRYRLLCTATAAPNDYIELGTSAEALGEMGHLDMLMKFFKNDQNSIKTNRNFTGDKWRFKHHAEQPFWRWVSSWARACRKPSDLGFADGKFILPPLNEVRHIIKAKVRRPGYLFDTPAYGLDEQRQEAARTIVERCEKVAELCESHDRSLVWCNRNEEGDMLEKIIPGAVQVAGKHSDDEKESRLSAFANGEIRVLVTKPKIGAWGLNLQRCAHVTFFTSHSYEQYYQGVRRCWRFGQERPVTVDIIATEGEVAVLDNLNRKSEAADRMFTSLVANMNASLKMARTSTEFAKQEEIPSWL